jgi:hypothetical protein
MGGERPLPRETELSKRFKEMSSQPKEVRLPAPYLVIYEQAKLQHKWIYDPKLKRWQTPEEFFENEKRYAGGEPDRLSRLQVRDPMDGIKASYVQLQDLKERMELFVKRVLEYYKQSPKRT